MLSTLHYSTHGIESQSRGKYIDTIRPSYVQLEAIVLEILICYSSHFEFVSSQHIFEYVTKVCHIKGIFAAFIKAVQSVECIAIFHTCADFASLYLVYSRSDQK